MAMQQPAQFVHVRQLKEQTADVLRRVDEGKEIIDVVDGGRVIARLIPVPTSISKEERHEILQRHRKLAEDIGRAWKDDVSAVDAVKEVRRDL